ncbi:MAG: hypothetical protein V7746_17335 [Halioglobus sp.]
MVEPSGSDLSSTIEALGEALPESLKWEWDDRFDGVLAAFEVIDKDHILEILNSQFGQAWDGTSISNAPDSISCAIQEFGRMTANQLLFTSDSDRDVILLGLWWPWGNGATISIRFITYASENSASDKESVRSALRGAFGL